MDFEELNKETDKMLVDGHRKNAWKFVVFILVIMAVPFAMTYYLNFLGALVEALVLKKD